MSGGSTSGAHPVGPGPPPRLIPAAPEHSWLELFYDLVFVAAIVVMSTTYSNYAGLDGIVWLGLVFSMMWFTWLATTVLLGVGLVTTFWTRTLLLVQMVLVLAVAIFSDYSFEDHSIAVGPLFAAVLCTTALLYRAARRSDPDLDAAYRGYGLRCVISAALFAVAPLIGWPWWYPLLWLVGLAVFVLPVGAEERHRRMDGHRVVHRFGEFTIIMLGEVFVKLGITATHEPLDRVDLFALPLAVAVVFGIWWLYFTDVPDLGLSRHHRRRLGWVYLHFPLHLGLIASAVALAHTLVDDQAAARHDAPTVGTIQYIVVPVAVILVAIGLIGALSGGPRDLTRRRLRTFLSAAAALVVAEIVLLGSDSYDLEASTVVVTIVLFATAWRIRVMGEPPDLGPGPDHPLGSDAPGA